VGGVPERPNAAATKRIDQHLSMRAAGHDTGRPELLEDDGSSDLTALMWSFKTLPLRADRCMAAGGLRERDESRIVRLKRE
jgi:hypothetical protein